MVALLRSQTVLYFSYKHLHAVGEGISVIGQKRCALDAIGHLPHEALKSTPPKMRDILKVNPLYRDIIIKVNRSVSIDVLEKSYR